MALYALDAIDDALDATGRYRPHGPLEWAWVVLVAGTVASPGFGLPTGGNSSGGMPAESRRALAEALPASVPDVLPLVVAGLVVGWLCFVVTGAFLEFPFLRWLRDGDLALREEVRANWRHALGLAVFRVLVQLVTLVVLVWTTVAIAGRGPDPWTYLVVLVEYWVLFALLGLLTGVVSSFTTAFVVPAMWIEDRGVLEGWRRVWPTIRDAPKQFLAFGVAVGVLTTLGGILVAVAAVVALVPALAAALAVASAVGGVAGIAVGAVLGGILGAVVVGLVYAFLQVFLRYYALFVLGDVEPELDAIPERRRNVRAATGGEDPDGDGGRGRIDRRGGNIGERAAGDRDDSDDDSANDDTANDSDDDTANDDGGHRGDDGGDDDSGDGDDEDDEGFVWGP